MMNLTALAAVRHAATTAQVVRHLIGRQVVPGLVVITVLLLTLVILFGPGGPLSRARRLTRRSPTARPAVAPPDSAAQPDAT